MMSPPPHCSSEPVLPGHRLPSICATLAVSSRSYPLPDIGSPLAFSDQAIGILEDVRRAMEVDPEAAREAALRLLTFLSMTPAAEAAGSRGGLAPWQKRKVERYMGDNLEHPLLIEKLAQHLPLSLSHFCRAFKESFGTTPHVHIMRLRLAMAQRLMLTTREPLSQIALACGLADQAHLSKLFRRWVGETPNAWRRRNFTEGHAETKIQPPTGRPFAKLVLAPHAITVPQD
jgi:AraC family transcriptional regulator